jgi:hypothetical protein
VCIPEAMPDQRDCTNEAVSVLPAKSSGFDEKSRLTGDSNPSIGRVRIKEHDFVRRDQNGEIVRNRAPRRRLAMDAHLRRARQTADGTWEGNSGVGADVAGRVGAMSYRPLRPAGARFGLAIFVVALLMLAAGPLASWLMPL